MPELDNATTAIAVLLKVIKKRKNICLAVLARLASPFHLTMKKLSTTKTITRI